MASESEKAAEEYDDLNPFALEYEDDDEPGNGDGDENDVTDQVQQQHQESNYDSNDYHVEEDTGAHESTEQQAVDSTVDVPQEQLDEGNEPGDAPPPVVADEQGPSPPASDAPVAEVAPVVPATAPSSEQAVPSQQQTPAGDAAATENVWMSQTAVTRAKLDVLSTITNFEDRRSRAEATRFNANQIYWRALCEVLRESAKETAEIHTFFVAWLACFGEYTNAAGALADKRRSGKFGKPAAKAAQQSPRHQSVSSGQPTDLVTMSPCDMLLQLEQTIAVRRKEFCEWVRVNVVEGQAHRMQEEFSKESTALIAQGEQCFRELMSAEDLVQSCYKKLRAAASGEQSASAASPAAAAVTYSQAEQEALARDLWLADARYRVSVVRLMKCRQRVTRKLGTIFTRVKALEARRRQVLRATIDAFLRRRIELWNQLPALAMSVVNKMARLAQNYEVERKETEEEVSRLLRAKAAVIAAEYQLSESKEIEQEPSESQPEAREAELTSPLHSALLVRCAVLERRVPGFMTSWQRCLMTVTADGYLHLFELDSHSPSDPGAAFAHIAPVQIQAKPGSDAAVPMLDKEFLVPVLSMNLVWCKIEFKPNIHENAFEIAESLANAGVMKLFSARADRHVVLRAPTQEQMVDWIVLCRDCARQHNDTMA